MTKSSKFHMDKHKPSQKRTRNESDESGDVRWKFPRFYIIESTNQELPMSKTTPTKGHLILKGLVGTVDRVIRMANGNLIVGLVREGQVENLMKIEKFGDIPCRVMEYQQMNTKKGVIRCPAFHGNCGRPCP